MKRFCLIAIALLSINMMAQQGVNEVEKAFAQRIYQAQEKNDEAEFMAAEKAFMDYQLEKKNWDKYYNIWMNRVIFNVNNKHFYQAFTEIQQMTDDIQERGLQKYHYIPNQALGIYYVNRDNHELGERYLLKALEKAKGINNPIVTANIYISLAQALSFTKPKEAMAYLDRLPPMEKNPAAESGVLSYRCIIAYEMNEVNLFKQYFHQYDSIRQDNPELFNEINYENVMVYHNLLEQDYASALAWCDSLKEPSDRAELRSLVYKKSGQYEKALKELEIKDSIKRIAENSVIEQNMNNLTLTLAQMEEEHNKAIYHQRLLIILGLFGTVIFILMALSIYFRHRNITRLKQQYLLVKEAQERTKEALAIRRSFVESMKARLNSPINMLMGYARVFNDPHFHLIADQRPKAFHDIAISAKSIDALIEPVIDSFLHGDVAISDQQKQLCEDALRSPISSLIGMAELLSEDKEHQIPENDYLQMRTELSRDAYQVATATKELVLFSLMAEDEKVEKSDHVGLNEIAKTALIGHDIRNHALKRQFTSDVDDGVIICTNQNYMQELLTFLLHNADKYAKSGKVSVHCHQEPDQRYSIAVSNEGDTIKAEDEERIFEPFVRMSEQSHGIGLGLALARQIATSMDYKIALDKTYKAGTKFIINGI